MHLGNEEKQGTAKQVRKKKRNVLEAMMLLRQEERSEVRVGKARKN